MIPPALRPATPGDYDAIAAVVDTWWGRPILPSLPRLFLDHFHRTSLIASTGAGELAGFLVGFPSPSAEDEAYIHFVGVSPAARGTGLGRRLYEAFFGIAREHGRQVVKAITSPVNEGSIAFHRRMGFTVRGPHAAYNGPGTTLITFERTLS
ncbi:GNAT family N-acetyltransferase [Nonomuraea wenchangensis]|uniref:GNAT family N-acetyltransferase n=1 Tax=Nonomuraea wenchangensis TaxID=568860 RepID=UPI00343DF1A6